MPVRLMPRPAPLEMLTTRPKRCCFMPGATACAMKNAPDRLTSKIACQSLSEISSSGRPTWPSTPPALLTRMSMRRHRRLDFCDDRLDGAPVADIENMRNRQCSPAQRNGLGEPGFVDVADMDACAALANAFAMARPKPCAAPVTITVRPLNSMFMRLPALPLTPSSSSRLASASERLAVLDLVDQFDDRCAVSGRRYAERSRRSRRPARAGHRPRSCACGRRGRARCRNAISPSGGCGRPSRRRNARSSAAEAAGREGRRIEAVERLRPHAVGRWRPQPTSARAR